MKNILLLVVILLINSTIFSQNKKQRAANSDTDHWRYEIESIDVGVQGTVSLKVWSYSAKPDIAAAQAAKNAVHGVIFKGVPAKDRVQGKKPLVGNIDENPEFFKSFFADGGEYMKYVALTNNGAIEAGEVMKIDKKTYKVGINVSVNYSQLRKALEDANIVKKLGAGF